jgi:hypothetical protein
MKIFRLLSLSTEKVEDEIYTQVVEGKYFEMLVGRKKIASMSFSKQYPASSLFN